MRRAEVRRPAADIVRLDRLPMRQVPGERLVEDAPKLPECRDIVLVKQPARIGRHVQEQHAVPPDRTVVDLDQLLWRLHARVLGGVIEPPGPDGRVAQRHHPLPPVRITAV